MSGDLLDSLKAKRIHVDGRTFTRQLRGTPVGGIYTAGAIGLLVTNVDDYADEDQDRQGENRCTTGTGIVLRNGQSESCALQRNTAVFILMVTTARSTASSPLLTTLNIEGLAAAVRRVPERSWNIGCLEVDGGFVSGGVDGGGRVGDVAGEQRGVTMERASKTMPGRTNPLKGAPIAWHVLLLSLAGHQSRVGTC